MEGVVCKSTNSRPKVLLRKRITLWHCIALHCLWRVSDWGVMVDGDTWARAWSSDKLTHGFASRRSRIEYMTFATKAKACELISLWLEFRLWIINWAVWSSVGLGKSSLISGMPFLAQTPYWTTMLVLLLEAASVNGDSASASLAETTERYGPLFATITTPHYVYFGRMWRNHDRTCFTIRQRE